MPEQIFLPYAYADAALEINPLSIELDGQTVSDTELVNREHSSIALATADSWSRFELKFEVVDVNDQLADLLPEDISSSVVDVYSILRDSETRQRSAAKLNRVDDRTWRGTISFARENRHGTASWQVLAVRASDGKENGRHAFRKGERIADSRIWHVYFDDKLSVPGGVMETEWRDFANDARQELKDSKDNVWYLDLRDSRRPRLFANEGIKGLKRALETGQRTGKAARVRDAIANSILQPVLTQMAVFALKDVRDNNFDEMDGWKKQLLLSMSRHHHGQTEELTIERWQQAWRDDDRAPVLADLANAIQRHIRLSKSCEKLIKALEERQNG